MSLSNYNYELNFNNYSQSIGPINMAMGVSLFGLVGLLTIPNDCKFTALPTSLFVSASTLLAIGILQSASAITDTYFYEDFLKEKLTAGMDGLPPIREEDISEIECYETPSDDKVCEDLNFNNLCLDVIGLLSCFSLSDNSSIINSLRSEMAFKSLKTCCI